MKKPKVCILKTDGINCDEETSYAFTRAGGESEIVHVNQLRSGAKNLEKYQILALPGGFSYGDDVVSGKILAVELLSFLKEQLHSFVKEGKLIIGICNGFQVLVRTGLLPFSKLGEMQATLVNNASGVFICKWVEIAVVPSPCVFTQGLEGHTITLQIAHGEGKFSAHQGTLRTIEENHLVALRYRDNPNGSLNDIAGICDPSGRIFGLMPHPERFVERHHFPNWRREPQKEPHGLKIFENGIRFAQTKLL